MRTQTTLALLGGTMLALAATTQAQAPLSHTNAIQPVTVKAGKSAFLSVSLTQTPLDYGTITALTATTVTDSSADYTGLTGPLALQILSGDNRGKTVQVTATSGSNLTVAENLTSLAAVGDEFVLIREWTLNTLFGDPGVGGNPSGLVGGSAFSSSIDNVQLTNPTTGTVTTYFYKNTTPTGWRVSTNPVTNVGTTRIGLNEGVIVNRRQATDLTIDLRGAVRVGRQSRTLEGNGGGHNGINIVSIHNPAGVTLDASGLSSVLIGGGSFSSAIDQVFVKDTNGDTRTYWYKTTTPVGWRLSTNAVTNQGTVLIQPGAAVYIRRPAGSADVVYHQNQTIQP